MSRTLRAIAHRTYKRKISTQSRVDKMSTHLDNIQKLFHLERMMPSDKFIELDRYLALKPLKDK